MGALKEHIVICSTFIDEQIRDEQPDIEFLFFKSIKELSDYSAINPIRAEKMYITKEILGLQINNTLNYIITLLDNPLINITKVEYITNDMNDKDVHAIKFLREQGSLKNWTIKKGVLSRDYLSAFINGSLSSEEQEPQRKVIIRQSKNSYINEKIKKHANPEQEYSIYDEDLIKASEDIDYPEYLVSENVDICNIVRVAGNDTEEKDIFLLIMAQYLAFEGKVLLIENDFKYLTLSDMISKANIEYEDINIDDIYNNWDDAKHRIKTSSHNLIFISSNKIFNTNYGFLCTLLYANLKNSIKYMLTSHTLEEMTHETKYIVVFPNKLVDILKLSTALPAHYSLLNTYVAIEIQCIKELLIDNPYVLGTILTDLLQIPINEVPILNIESLKIGGTAHDLRMLL